MPDRPLILCSNDDGIEAPGLLALADGLAELGEVVVCAPDRERSAAGHAISLDVPLRVTNHGAHRYAVSGTPVDCVYLAMLHLCPRPPALVVSGINRGLNMGSDVFYSGTVAAAVEGAIRGAPAVAVSLSPKGTSRGVDAYREAARFARALCEAILEQGLPPATVLNVNVPADAIHGYRFTRLGQRVYRDMVDVRTDPRGRHYYWIGGPDLGHGDVPGSDCDAVANSHASITPLDLDLTHHGLLETLPGWKLAGFEAVLRREHKEAEGQ
jgi:5'-nucleotidase